MSFLLPVFRGETGKASTRKVLALRLSPPRDNLSRSLFIGLGAPSSFPCPVIRQRYSARRLPHNGKRRPGGTGGQPVLLRIVAVGRPVPFAALVLFALSRGGSHSAPATRLPALRSGPPTVPLWRERKPPLIYHQKKHRNGAPNYRFFLRYFFMVSSPRRTERRTTLLSVPSSRAISR